MQVNTCTKDVLGAVASNKKCLDYCKVMNNPDTVSKYRNAYFSSVRITGRVILKMGWLFSCSDCSITVIDFHF